MGRPAGRVRAWVFVASVLVNVLVHTTIRRVCERRVHVCMCACKRFVQIRMYIRVRLRVCATACNLASVEVHARDNNVRMEVHK